MEISYRYRDNQQNSNSGVIACPDTLKFNTLPDDNIIHWSKLQQIANKYHIQ